MLLIRNFEIRGEAAYLQGKVGGFYHSYSGQEAIATGQLVASMGREQWWSAFYRIHGLALLLGQRQKSSWQSSMAGQLAMPKGAAVHEFSPDQLLGGGGIVVEQIPLGTGAAFTIKYLDQKKVAVTFLGDGAVAQGAFHECLEHLLLYGIFLASYVIENNMWGMGTAVERAISRPPHRRAQSPQFCYEGLHS